MKSYPCLALVAAALLSGCVTETSTPGIGGDGVFTIPNPIDPCGAGSVQFLKGRPESALKGRRYAAPVRILRDGDEVDPRDVNPNRLTVSVSGNGRIASLVCS